MNDQCQNNIDDLKLVRQGTNQNQRVLTQLKPDYVQVDEHKIPDTIVFAKAYAQYLKFYGSNDEVIGDWGNFFSQDISIPLAIAAIQNIEDYKTRLKESFDYLNNREHEKKEAELNKHLGCLFSCIGSLAIKLEELKVSLNEEIKLKLTLINLIQSQLSFALKKLISYYKAFPNPDDNFTKANSDFILLGSATKTFSEVYTFNFSKDWITPDTTEENKKDWQSYINSINKDKDNSVYGTPPSDDIFTRLNHIATHNLFTAIFDQFLKVFVRVVNDAKSELEKTLTTWNKHQPHYALFLAFLKLLDYTKSEINTLTQRHLDFYYRDILKLKEKPAEPSHAHILIELAKHIDSHEITANELFKAGKDNSGKDVFFAKKNSFVANKAKVTELKSLYLHENNPNKLNDEKKSKDFLEFQNNRLFASPIANSADGLGAKLTIVDQSWHPFTNKIYENDKLKQINMPKAEIGFAIASHYLWMAEGDRTIKIKITIDSTLTSDSQNKITKDNIVCFLSTEKGWFEKLAESFNKEQNIFITLEVKLSGADPAITPYLSKIHGYNFSTDSPMLLVKLRHQDNEEYIYSSLKNIVIEKIDLTVNVDGIKSLAVSNDFGAIDTLKPFQPFGASPIKNSALIIGSKELFQKELSSITIKMIWKDKPNPYKITVNIIGNYLWAGSWNTDFDFLEGKDIELITDEYGICILTDNSNFKDCIINKPDFSSLEPYNIKSKQGFIRLKIDNDFGQNDYKQALIDSVNIKSSIDRIIAVINIINTTTLLADEDKSRGKILEQAINNIEIIKYDLENNIKYLNSVKYPVNYAPVQNKALLMNSNSYLKMENFQNQFYTKITIPDTILKWAIFKLNIAIDNIEKNKSNLAIQNLNNESDDNKGAIQHLTYLINSVDQKPPLGPFATELCLNYTANQIIEIINNDKVIFEQRTEKFFHLTPFNGQCERHKLLTKEEKVFLVPQFENAEFYIGITGLKPPQNLALLFQVADGTADPQIEKPEQHIQWRYLSNNEWIILEKNQIQDNTDNLLNSGIITFAIPDNASSNNTVLPTGQYWLKASVTEKSEAVCKLINVFAQGLKITFQDQKNDPNFLEKVLPAETISKLKQPDAAVKKISQPFEGFGGRAKEKPETFYTRVSERLRHKDRAITLWDYEHLILEAFPQIYQVKCLNHTTPDGNELAAGNVTIVTIPNRQFQKLRDPLRPYTSRGLLEEIKKFLKKKLPCFVEPDVVNPLFEEVSVKFNVKFHFGDETFLEQKLREAITQFLSPWAFSDMRRPTFGGKIYQSVLLNFVEELPYVDYVTDFQLLHHVITTDGVLKKQPKTEIEGTKAISILVSAYSDQHNITTINSDDHTPDVTTCPCTAL